MEMKKPFSRREFLKMSALVIGSSASLGVASSLVSRLESEGQGELIWKQPNLKILFQLCVCYVQVVAACLLA